MGIAEKALVLKQDFDEVYKAGASDFGLKGKGQGELVTLNNVHPIEHKVEVGLSSKNLFNEDTANITKTEDYFSSNIHYSQGSFFELAVQPNEAYTVSYSCLTPNEGVWGAQVLLGVCKTPTWVGASVIARTLLHERHYLNFSADTLTFKVPADVYTIYIQATTALQFKSFMIEKGTTATAYAPYVADFSDCKVTASGKNLFNEDKANITKTEDYFKSNVSYWQSPCSTIPVESGATYTCSCEYYTPNVTTFNTYLAYSISTEKTYTSASKALAVQLKTQSSTEGYSKVSNTFTVPDGIEEVYFLADSEGVGTFFKKFQIEKGTTATEYEPYTGAEYTAAADGTVEGVKSISPVMNILADKAGAVIDAECFLDPQAVITDLTNTVITLGGEI